MTQPNQNLRDPSDNQSFDPNSYPEHGQTSGPNPYTAQTDNHEPDSQQYYFDEEPQEPRLTFGRVAYFGLLAVVVLVLIGLPIWYLLNQEEPGEVAGVRDEQVASDQETGQAQDDDSSINEEEIYIYDPETQTFKTKEGDNSDSSSSPGGQNRGGSSGDSINLNPGEPINGVTFAEAFAQARSQLGSGSVFEWNGQLYSTDFRANEPQGIDQVYPENIYANLNPSQWFVNDSAGKVLEINECNLNLKYPTKTANGALVSFDRVDLVDGKPPYWNFYAFTGYNDAQEKYGEGYTIFVQCFNLSELGESYQPVGEEESANPRELYEKTGWFIADESIENLQMSRNEGLVHGYSITFTRGGQLYSMNFMTKPKDSGDQIGGLYSYQVQLQFQDLAQRQPANADLL